MKINNSQKIFVTTLFLCLAFSNNIVHDWFVDSRTRDIQTTLHNQVINKAAPSPIQYRIFVHYLAEVLMDVGIEFRAAYQLIRIVFTFSSLYAFFIFLMRFFTWDAALIGSLFLTSALPLTYIRYYMQPMEMPNLFFFIASYIIILKKKDWMLVPVVIVAMLNRETAILITLVYLFFRWGEIKFLPLLLRTVIIGGVALGTYAFLRTFFQLKPYYSDLYYLDFNLSDIRTYLYAVFLFGPFLFTAFYRLNSKPLFLKRAALMLPFFLIIHYTMTIMVEPRLWLPVFPLVIALGLYSFVPENMKLKLATEKKDGNKYDKLIYLAAITVFIVGFYAFFSWYETAHLKDRALFLRKDGIINSAKRYLAGGWKEKAGEELKRGLAVAPNSDELHYQLGILYAYHLYDDSKALEHFQKCLKLNPYHLVSCPANTFTFEG